VHLEKREERWGVCVWEKKVDEKKLIYFDSPIYLYISFV
jgi:hypothetical protein